MTFDVEVRQGERCWIFASLNTMRHRVIRRYGLKTFELSQAYPLFWDKLEKSNWFLANVLDTLDEPLDGRLVSYLLSDPICDGGQWDMFHSLVRKYGVVPKEAMPETACSRNTREMDKYLTRYLRGCARRLRESAGTSVGADDLAAMRREMMGDVHPLRRLVRRVRLSGRRRPPLPHRRGARRLRHRGGPRARSLGPDGLARARALANRAPAPHPRPGLGSSRKPAALAARRSCGWVVLRLISGAQAGRESAPRTRRSVARRRGPAPRRRRARARRRGTPPRLRHGTGT